jgi:hypothetical protein
MSKKIDMKLLGTLTARGISLLKLSSSEWSQLEEKRGAGIRFSLSFEHAVAHSGKPKTLTLIAVNGDITGLRLGMIRSIQATTSLDSRVVFDLVKPILPSSFDALLDRISVVSLRAGIKKLRNEVSGFRAISSKLGEQIVELIASTSENTPVLQRILAETNRPTKYEDARALQDNAVELALKAFGAIDGASQVILPGENTAIGTVRLLEDAVIEHDARWLPSWGRLAKSTLTGKAVFKKKNQQLEVFTANKRPLEKLFGVDLIYFNKARGSIVMVQYKMMESVKNNTIQKIIFSDSEETDGYEWTVKIDHQFREEMARMKKFDKDLEPNISYRLNPGAFFFKLVRRHSAMKSTGIVLSLGHLKQLIGEDHLLGRRGGLSISYEKLDGHYLRSDPFTDLINSGYIGTRGATTKHIETLINETLNGGRAVVAAIETKMKEIK